MFSTYTSELTIVVKSQTSNISVLSEREQDTVRFVLIKHA